MQALSAKKLFFSAKAASDLQPDSVSPSAEVKKQQADASQHVGPPSVSYFASYTAVTLAVTETLPERIPVPAASAFMLAMPS